MNLYKIVQSFCLRGFDLTTGTSCIVSVKEGRPLNRSYDRISLKKANGTQYDRVRFKISARFKRSDRLQRLDFTHEFNVISQDLASILQQIMASTPPQTKVQFLVQFLCTRGTYTLTSVTPSLESTIYSTIVHTCFPRPDMSILPLTIKILHSTTEDF